MLRARLPLAVALLTAFVFIPATAASATGSDPVTKAVTQASDTGSSGSGSTVSPNDTSGTSTGSSTGSTGSSGTTSSSTTGSSGSSTGSSGTTTGSSTGSSTSGTTLGGLTTGGSTPTNPFAGTPLAGVGALLTNPSSLPTSLQTLGTCLQGAGTDPTKGQTCFETFFDALGLPASCFSANNFTAAYLEGQLQSYLSANKQPSASDLQTLATQVQGLLGCLTSTSSAPTSDAPTAGGGADAPTTTPTTTSDVAPAAVAVTGTPNFTG